MQQVTTGSGFLIHTAVLDQHAAFVMTSKRSHIPAITLCAGNTGIPVPETAEANALVPDANAF